MSPTVVRSGQYTCTLDQPPLFGSHVAHIVKSNAQKGIDYPWLQNGFLRYQITCSTTAIY